MSPNSEQNICNPGTGLFETHVTWEDLEKNMQKALGTRAVFGANKTIKNIGEGNRARAGENLPKTFVAKLCTAVTLIAFAKMAMGAQKEMEGMFEHLIQMVKLLENDVKQFHNTEVDVFDLFKKYGLSKAMQAPKVYYQQKFTEDQPLKGHIIMEYVENVASPQIYDTLPVEALDQPLRSLAVLEAASLRFTDEEKYLFKTNPLAQIHKQYFIPGKSDAVIGVLTALGHGKWDKQVEQLTAKLPQLLDIAKYDSIVEKLGMTRVLCHGDTWTPNILWRKNQLGYKMAAIIDYQTAHFGNAAGDLCRLFNTSLTGKDRRKYTDVLLKKFYKFLTEELRGEPAPYTYEQLKKAYDLYFPMGAYIQLQSVGPLMDLVVRTSNSEEKAKACSSTRRQRQRQRHGRRQRRGVHQHDVTVNVAVDVDVGVFINTTSPSTSPSTSSPTSTSTSRPTSTSPATSTLMNGCSSTLDVNVNVTVAVDVGVFINTTSPSTSPSTSSPTSTSTSC